jgi:hypothetical protein
VGDVCIVCRGEIARLLQLLTGWLTRGPARLGSPLEDFVGSPACNIGQLRHDRDRLTFLPGGSSGPGRPGDDFRGRRPSKLRGQPPGGTGCGK